MEQHHQVESSKRVRDKTYKTGARLRIGQTLRCRYTRNNDWETRLATSSVDNVTLDIQ